MPSSTRLPFTLGLGFSGSGFDPDQSVGTREPLLFVFGAAGEPRCSYAGLLLRFSSTDTPMTP